MSDPQLSDLFAEGTAPETDLAFVRQVSVGIGRRRRFARLGALVLRGALVLAFSAAAFVAVSAIEPLVAQLIDGAPQVMGAPLPVVLGVLSAGLAMIAWRRVSRYGAGVGFLEPID